MITIDVGNTSIQFAWFKDKRIIKTSKLLTDKADKTTIYKALGSVSCENILVCSVVPEITNIFKGLRNNICVVGKDINVPIKSFYNRKEIGMDRLVGAYCVKELFPKTRLILDFGSAITLDFLSKLGDYQGGLIFAGIGSTIKALSKCALLPKEIKFKKTKKLIPTTTKESINKGLEVGFSLMANSLIAEYKKKLKIPFSQKVVITGGEAKVVMHKLNFPYKYEPNLVLKGLGLLANKFLP